MFAWGAAALVGGVFVVTGVLKAIDARRFEQQLHRYRLLPVQVVPVATLAFIALELSLIHI